MIFIPYCSESKSIEGSDNRHFLSNIINRIRNILPKPILNDCFLKNRYIENNELIGKIRYIENNELLRTSRFKSAMNDSELINFPRYSEIWLDTILNTDQLHILDKIWYNNYRRVPYIPWEKYMKKYIIYDYVKSGLACAVIKKDPLMKEDKQIRERLYEGDVAILNYYKKMKFMWLPSYVSDMVSKWDVYLLYGGHLNLFLEHLRYQNRNIDNYHELIITCLLRCNHVDQYKMHASTMQHLDTVKPRITFQNILTNFLAADFVLPVMTVITFKFCVKEFGLEVRIPRDRAYINAVSKQIWKNHTIDNSGSRHVISRKNGKNNRSLKSVPHKN